MTGPIAGPVYRRYGLYYPYFNVRNELWLKMAALYWPKMVRIVPEDYSAQDSDAVRALAGDFITTRPPGRSVEAVAPRFLDLLANHADELRGHLNAPEVWRELQQGPFSAVYASEMTPAVQAALVDARLAWPRHPWVIMHSDLVAVYTSVLAEDFAIANQLQPTTDQDDAYFVANNWTADQIASVLIDRRVSRRLPDPGDLPRALGFLALKLVVPANLDTIPISKIIHIRDRYGPEFTAFGHAIDQAAASMTELSGVRDQEILKDYLRDVVQDRFAEPLEELRDKMKRLTGDAAMLSINVKTQLPASAALVGGTWLTGNPLIAGITAAAIGLIGIRRGMREQRHDVLAAAPAASFLLHTQDDLRPQDLLSRTLHRLAHLTGTGAD